MARYRKEFTLSKNTIDFLTQQKNASRTIDEAIQFFQNKDKKVVETKPKVIPEVRIIG